MTRRWIAFGLLGLWGPALTVTIASLMVDHVAALPALGDPEVLGRGLDRRLGRGPRIVHVIAAGCSCTRGLVRHLTERGPVLGWPEIVLFVGEPPPGDEDLRARGFTIEQLARDELRGELALDGAPVLVVQGEGGDVAYAGGYFDVPAAIHAHDERIVAAVDAGSPPPSLPLYGCAVDPGLAVARDPFGARRALDGLDRLVRGGLGLD